MKRLFRKVYASIFILTLIASFWAPSSVKSVDAAVLTEDQRSLLQSRLLLALSELVELRLTLLNIESGIDDVASKTFVRRQDSSSREDTNDSLNEFQNDLSESFTTDSLTVTGDATFNGNVTYGGSSTVTGSSIASFFTASDANATSTFAGTLTVEGKLGIGTSTPGYTLDVYGNGRFSNSSGFAELWLGNTGVKIQNEAANLLRLESGTVSTGTTGWVFSRHGGGNNKVYFGDTGTRSWIQAGHELAFRSGEGGSANAEGAPHLLIDASGNVGIGTTTPSYLLHITRASDGDVAGFTDSNGTCTINPTSTSLICSSDQRLKRDITNLDSEEVLERLSQIQGVSFKWNSQDTDELRYGFIAQDVEAIFPDLVSTQANGFKSVAYTGFTPYLVESVKELNLKLSDLTEGLPGVDQEGERLSLIERIVGWMKDNVITVLGIKAEEGTIDKINTEELCVGSTCITESELQEFLDSRDGPTVLTPVNPEPDSSNEDEVPLIEDVPLETEDEFVPAPEENIDVVADLPAEVL